MYLEPIPSEEVLISLPQVSISFGDLVYLEHSVVIFDSSLEHVSISFGDLVYLEP